MGNNEGIRLQVYMAKSGVGSRRRCEKYIEEGLVKINGKTIIVQGVRVDPEDRVTYKGKVLHPTKKMVYVALNKPTRYLCSSFDPEERPLAIDLLKGVYPVRLFNVGRLDFLSTGLIFFTNDGNFSKLITHPSSGIEKEYMVETSKEIPEKYLQDFKKGVYIDNEKYRCLRYEYKTPFKVKIVLNEGKNREIRNFFLAKNYKIKKLHRIRIGVVVLRKIPVGSYRNLSEKEINWFLKGNQK